MLRITEFRYRREHGEVWPVATRVWFAWPPVPGFPAPAFRARIDEHGVYFVPMRLPRVGALGKAMGEGVFRVDLPKKHGVSPGWREVEPGVLIETLAAPPFNL